MIVLDSCECFYDLLSKLSCNYSSFSRHQTRFLCRIQYLTSHLPCLLPTSHLQLPSIMFRTFRKFATSSPSVDETRKALRIDTDSLRERALAHSNTTTGRLYTALADAKELVGSRDGYGQAANVVRWLEIEFFKCPTQLRFDMVVVMLDYLRELLRVLCEKISIATPTASSALPPTLVLASLLTFRHNTDDQEAVENETRALRAYADNIDGEAKQLLNMLANAHQDLRMQPGYHEAGELFIGLTQEIGTGNYTWRKALSALSYMRLLLGVYLLNIDKVVGKGDLELSETTPQSDSASVEAPTTSIAPEDVELTPETIFQTEVAHLRKIADDHHDAAAGRMLKLLADHMRM